MPFTDAEVSYLRTQYLGRLATVDSSGAPQCNPVGISLNDDGTIDIGGRAMAGTRKYRNVQRTPHVALVVDDLPSTNPWVARGVEIRGIAEITVEAQPRSAYMSPDIIRVHPRVVFSWGLDPDVPGMVKHTFEVDD